MRNLIFAAIALLVFGAVVEAASYVTARLAPTLFDARGKVLSRFHPDDLERFRNEIASPVLGWDNPANTTRTRVNCLGKDVKETFGHLRERRHAERPAGNAVIIVAGDSYAYGDDVGDGETFPAALEQRLSLPVANLGVRGYGPTQALLKLQGSIDSFPKARIAILSIMYDDIYRMVNAYRPAYAINTSFIYGFKPFMRDGVPQPLTAPDPWADPARFKQAANQAFDSDFWRKPKADFPYARALARAYTSPAGVDVLLSNFGIVARKPRLEMVFAPLGLRSNLLALIGRFATFTKTNTLKGFVVLVPGNGRSARSGRFLVESLEPDMPAGLGLVNIAGDIDWTRFNLKPGGGCHPSPYGYGVIADQMAAVIGER